MNQKTIVITVGPIPARLDSVKFVTNRFKGGLALKTALSLKRMGNKVIVVAWKFLASGSEIPDELRDNIVPVDDVIDYYHKVLAIKADAYVLAAAVANLMPSSPYEGKFPSHMYKVGDKFNVEFEIAPRLIDAIKQNYPRSTLVGYKLFDGSNEELIDAAKHTLKDSKANVIFANHTAWAKTKKIVLTQDGSVFECTFDQHVELIHKVINCHFYSTIVTDTDNPLLDNDADIISSMQYDFKKENDMIYGCAAVRCGSGFYTTPRGKQLANEKVFVEKVDHVNKLVYASNKATLNAPLLAGFFEKNPEFNYILHGHRFLKQAIPVSDEYEFPGSTQELVYAIKTQSGTPIDLLHHGYLVGFCTKKEVLDFLSKFNR